MGKHTLPGTIQIRVAIDADNSESFSTDLRRWLEERGQKVVECTADYNDPVDPTRKKFFVTAIPQEIWNMRKDG